MKETFDRAYSLKKLNSSDLKKLSSLLNSESWVSDHPFNYKSIPSWINIHESSKDYDELADDSIPSAYKDFGQYALKKYFKFDQKLTGACLWNGADNTGWHTDIDGDDPYTDKYTMIIYHIPRALSELDGGNIMIKNFKNGKVKNITPEDGMILLLNLDIHKYQHCVYKLVGDKDRFTLSFGFN